MNTEIETITSLAERAHENREQIVRRIAAFCAPVLRQLRIALAETEAEIRELALTAEERMALLQSEAP